METKINVPCTLETRISKTSGEPYQVLIIKLTKDYEKKVFLDLAEKELLKINNMK